MRANIIYILMAAGVLASCKDYADTEVEATYLNGTSKTPIAVKTNISTSPVSRAFDKTFESGDKLFAYIEAGKMADGAFDATASTFKWVDNFSLTREVTTSTEEGKGNITSTTEDSDLSPIIYWDDFSSTEYDLREEGRGIRLKYGYCYNGGEANATDKNETDGTLTWTVLADQSATGGADMKKSDLLYAKTQEMITYGHNPTDRGTLVLPYTHAMSKVTINVTAGEGYATDKANFASSVLTLKDMQIKADVNAPEATVTAVSTAGTSDVTTFIKSTENTKATYQAIIAPTKLSSGNLLAAITDIDGNNYEIPLTDGILDAWKAENKLIASDEVIYNGVAQAKPASRATITPGSGYITKPGIHYILDVTVEKQKITIRATITDWESVKAEGKALINFNPDVTTKGSIANDLKGNGFDVYKSSSNASFPATPTTKLTYGDNKWSYNPVIYWAGQSDASYFRAVSPAGGSTSNLAQGSDLLWGTSGNTAISPRTGDVPLTFEHLMSKLSINLQSVTGDAAVNLEGATIKVTNMANAGTYSIADGSVTSGSTEATMLEGKTSGFTEYVIPQTIGNTAKIVITLADGTTYSVQLNECKTTENVAVSEWTKGKSYTYTITLSKQEITFSAEVKDWENATASGSATLDWD